MRRKGGRHMTNNRVKNVDGMVGEGVEFERIRRITGYLVGDTKKFNNGKRAELNDRVKHGVTRRKKADRDREER
ncbi:MAG: hypothetical protein IJJ03_05325 [Mogibacterium sp.]|jgi:hypothetical protein|nr:hypothetical protein [Mogibacterium sp.]MBQ6500922.1 hypothetical protein [Mogibacterium sp.]